MANSCLQHRKTNAYKVQTFKKTQLWKTKRTIKTFQKDHKSFLVWRWTHCGQSLFLELYLFIFIFIILFVLEAVQRGCVLSNVHWCRRRCNVWSASSLFDVSVVMHLIWFYNRLRSRRFHSHTVKPEDIDVRLRTIT